MTNEIIQAIREEIARLQPNAPKPGNMKSVDAKVAMQVHARLNKLLSFISYLEKSLSAKVADDDDKVLEVEAVSYCFDNGLNISPRGAADFARHFYDIGCRRTAEKYDEIEYNRQRASGSSEIPNDLAAAAIDIADSLLAKPKDYVLSAKADYWNGAHDGVIAGAKWQADHAPLSEDTVIYQKGVEEGKRLMMEDYPKWRRIKAGERLPCPAYVWTIAYDNYPDCFEGRLMPNIQGVKVGRDTWYLPVDVIHNLPKEDEK